MSWRVKEESFNKENIVNNGNKFITGNGYMGFRGTLEEYTKNELVACNISGLYDKQGDKWREPINAPNGTFTTLMVDGEEYSVLKEEPFEHNQVLDIKEGVHRRNTEWNSEKGKIAIKAERFISLSNVHLICLKYTVTVDETSEIEINTGIDGDVWDINGPHLENYMLESDKNYIKISTPTQELKVPVVVAEICKKDFEAEEAILKTEKSILRNIKFKGEPGVEYTIYKYVSVYTGNDEASNIEAECLDVAVKGAEDGYDKNYNAHAAKWNDRWEVSDVIIEGNEDDQLALRYSIYQLHIIAPVHSNKLSIPARGLSGQTYKGAIFWDTEMFMLPFFLHTSPDVAINLVNYRIRTLQGAREKANYYGFKGAFYAWESQEDGQDACSDFNVTDVFTGRPVKTYFKDKQVHISAAVSHAIWETYKFTGDDNLLLNGGAEVILECARFYYSYAYFKEDKDRYEILDVIGPDEYHERVNNNAYTSKMVYHTLDIAFKILEILQDKYPEECLKLLSKIEYDKEEILSLIKFKEKLYVPKPDEKTLVIEQFSGYNELEDCTLEEVKSRLLDPKEYWGGGHGVASTTKIIKQADVVLMLNLFKNEYSKEVKKANWEYYEPRTEHGSSLSPCIYALLSCDIGNAEWAYPFFVKTSNVDLTGESKQFAGSIYIGGTHPAANGGAWMSAILGFGGLKIQEGKITIEPKLPKSWNRLAFKVILRGEKYLIDINRDSSSGVITESILKTS
ncbi:glycosyl hydrolase family 65 protein [Clostridium sp. 'White wine YQ']|uniref:glycosyl hydrolase family 65 protein n=1 Tax=Clostridium sp. 'White wine YQ' TaxID=3027474 RepID=UPI0023672FE7|nr:glycosyl hydrolase family 65 protein [Clostridium sp. 'White wine YQ']MDD7794400.1 glycosyl hydrolase family 65 protein [Clostridium sp. 'White wine YQ']